MKKQKNKIDVVEEFKLKWPDGVERTRIKERVSQGRWREGWKDTRDRLALELERLGATSILVTRHEKEDHDPGVAVWFSRVKEDFSWQQGLDIDDPFPSLERIDEAFKLRARKFHPDNTQTGDPEMFKKLSDYKNAAKAWVTGSHAHAHEYVMAIDQYNEARLNLKALQMAFLYIRRLEDVGAPSILSQTLGAFRTKLVAQTGTGGTVA
jgi:hypothetical protein